jgi:hypothetical protein
MCAMSSAQQGKPAVSTPPPLAPLERRHLAEIRARQNGKPPPLEFLPAEFVHDDVDAYEVLPDEFVVADDSAIAFAGPSDTPPRPEVPVTVAADTRPSAAHGEPSKKVGWGRTASLCAALAVACLVGAALFVRSTKTLPPNARAQPAAASPIYPSALAAVDTKPNPSAESSSATGPGSNSEAIETKEAARRGLELGKVGLAISLGERSVALDPTDADGWLILGAAYMQRGDNKNARRCFSSCLEQATSGERRECAAMLR